MRKIKAMLPNNIGKGSVEVWWVSRRKDKKGRWKLMIPPSGKKKGQTRHLVACPAIAMGITDWIILDYSLWRNPPSATQLQEATVLPNGDVYYVRYCGSAAKKKRVIATRDGTDPFLAWEVMRKAEDVYYLGTAFGSHAYGGAWVEEMTILRKEAGEHIELGGQDLVISDGMSYVADDVWEVVREGSSQNLVTFSGHPAPTYQFTMWLKLTEMLWEEIKPLLKRRLKSAAAYWRNRYAGDDLLDSDTISRTMAIHPDFRDPDFLYKGHAAKIEMNIAKYRYRSVTGVDYPEAITRILYPSPTDQVILPGVPDIFNHSAIGGFPMQGPNNVQASECVTDGPMAEWASHIHMGQWRGVSQDSYFKEAVHVIPRADMPPGVDVIQECTACKMDVLGLAKGREAGVHLFTGYLVCTMDIKEGRVICLPQELLDAMTRDVDGDNARIVPGELYPALYQAILNLPSWEVSKKKKSNNKIKPGYDMRYVTIANIMANDVGTIMNDITEWLQYTPATLDLLANRFHDGMTGPQLFVYGDRELAQPATDVPKNQNGVPQMKADLKTLDHLMHDQPDYGFGFKWSLLTWNKPENNPYRLGVTPDVDEWPGEFCGTVTKIAKWCIKRLKVVGSPKHMPMSVYADMVPKPSKFLQDAVGDYAMLYRAILRITDQAAEDWQEGFRHVAHEEFLKWAAEYDLSLEDAAAALWYHCHEYDSRTIVYAIMPFYAVDMAVWEELLSPGRVRSARATNAQEEFVLIGVHNNVPAGLHGDATVWITSIEKDGNKRQTLNAVAGHFFPSQIAAPKSGPYKKGHLGMLGSAVGIEDGTIIRVRFYPLVGRGRVSVKVLGVVGDTE